MKKKKYVRTNNTHLQRLVLMVVTCSLIYYLPSIVGLAGHASLQQMLRIPHDFYGLDFYALFFFIPVVYAAYKMGINSAVAISIASMALLIPYGIFSPYPDALFRPAAFAIILSSVGAVVAMLQKGDERQQQRLKELRCLHNIGKLADRSNSLEELAQGVTNSIAQLISRSEPATVRLRLRGRVFESPLFEELPHKLEEKLECTGEVLGTLEVYYVNCHQFNEEIAFLKAVAERLSEAVRRLELEESLRKYSEKLEEKVQERTKELKEAQEKLIRSERLAAVGELASGVGHELRNPLNVIRNCVYLLKLTLGERADQEVLNTLRLLDQQVDISNRIVTDLLNFTRVRSPTFMKVDLNTLVRESLSWVMIPESIKVSAELDGGNPQVKADPEQVGRAFANIVSNAVQAMKGEGTLRVSTGTSDGYAWASFEDTGCGIPPENLEKIFEPLFTTKRKGIGLGLAITKRLVEQNGGAIEVRSEVGKGSSFTVRLPIWKGEKGGL